MSSRNTRVWLKTSFIEKILYGKVKTSARRIAIAEIDEDDSDAGLICNWGWALGEIQGGEDSSGKMSVYIRDEESAYNRETISIPSDAMSKGEVVLANDYNDDEDEDGYEEAEYPEDMVVLTHLHEPAVVYCLRKRYNQDKIYTATGPILVALNPFKYLNDLYSPAMMKKYYLNGVSRMEKKSEGIDENEKLSPHVFRIADNSYRQMMTSLVSSSAGGSRKRGKSSQVNCNQSILVSGESGAGKTMTTKFIMKYLASLSQRDKSGTKKKSQAADKKSVEQQVLQSNPILESFGNARTIRNDNSSRFGKFIELQFTSGGVIVGACIDTYLLEKVRLVSQSPGERNYHVFYQILAAFTADERDKFFLEDFSAEDFNLTNESGTYDRRDGVDDYDVHSELMEGFDTMGFTHEDVDNIMSVTCACLHLSNCDVLALSADESKLNPDNEHLESVMKLIGTNFDEMNRALCYFSITAGSNTYVRSTTKEKSEIGIMGLVKATYGAMFDYIVAKVNSSITLPTTNKQGVRTAAFIGCLDIFGFESFKKNSFEQLCINYCNEALQRQFNIFVIENEQEEYTREGIEWSMIEFPENQDVLDLIDKKGFGILRLLDDQCRAPGCTDKSFAQAIYQKCTGHKRFEANHRQIGALKFGVKHYAGSVEYECEGFVEKNRDLLPGEAVDLLCACSNDFVKELGKILKGPDDSNDSSSKKSPAARGRRAPPPRSRKKKKKSVGSKFSSQLNSLLDKITTTSPHYVRCLKTNDLLVPDHFDPVIICDQLRSAGVIEAVRVSRLGYPQRYPHATFLNRYCVLGKKALKKASKRQKPVDALASSIAKQIFQMENPDAKKRGKSDPPIDLAKIGLQVGKTKVFLRQAAFDALEKLRMRQMAESTILIQKVARRYIALRDYGIVQIGVVQMQTYCRRNIAIVFTQALRETHAATIIQKYYRRYHARVIYLATSRAARWLQQMYRGRKDRARYLALNRIRKSIIIQKYWRAFFAYVEFQKLKSSIIIQKYWRRYYRYKIFHRQRKSVLIMQCSVRCYFARLEFKNLKLAAKDLQSMASDKKRLQEDNMKLMKRLAEASSKAQKEAQKAASAISALSAADQDELKQLRIEIKDKGKELEDTKDKLKQETIRANEGNFSAEASLKKIKEFQENSSKTEEELKNISQQISLKDDEINSLKKLCEESREEVEGNASIQKKLLSEQEESKIAMEKIVEENETLKQNLLNEQEKNIALREEIDEIEEEGDVVIDDYTRDNDELNNEVEVIDGQLDNAYKEIEKLKLELEVLKISSSSSPDDETTNVKDCSSFISTLEEDLKMSNILVDSLKEELRKEKVKVKFLRMMPKNWGFFPDAPNKDAGNDNNAKNSDNNSVELHMLLKDSEDEITSLKKELEIAKEANKETVRLRQELEEAKTRKKDFGEDLTKKNELFYSCVEKDENGLGPIQEELFDAKIEIESLKQELGDCRHASKLSHSDTSSRSSFFISERSMGNSYDFSSLPPDLSGAMASESSWCKKEDRGAEVERLEKELEKTKKQLEIATTRDYKRSMSINSRYEELVRLSGACLDKDSEIKVLRNDIELLRKEIENLRNELERSMKVSENRKGSQGEVRNVEVELEQSKEDDKEGFWGFWGGKEKEHQQSKIDTDTKQNSLGGYANHDEKTSALEDMNDMLRKELASACQELNETKRKLAEMELS